MKGSVQGKLLPCASQQHRLSTMGSQILTNLEIEGERQWGQKLGAVFYTVEELLAIKLDEPKKKKKSLQCLWNRQVRRSCWSTDEERWFLQITNWVAGLSEGEQFLQQMLGKMGLFDSRQRHGQNLLSLGLKMGKGGQEWLTHLLAMSPDSLYYLTPPYGPWHAVSHIQRKQTWE